MPIQRVSLLRCECGEPIVIPEGDSSQTSNILNRQPKIKWPLLFACKDCGKLSEHFPQDVLLEEVEEPCPSPHLVVLWRADFKCIHNGCGRLFAVHTKHRPNATVFEIAKTVFSAQPPPTCGCDDNHLMTFPIEPVRVYRVD